jgi:hypothetical protein
VCGIEYLSSVNKVSSFTVSYLDNNNILYVVSERTLRHDLTTV